jgi:hypothetical protein
MKQLDSRESAPDSAGLRQQELLLGIAGLAILLEGNGNR